MAGAWRPVGQRDTVLTTQHLARRHHRPGPFGGRFLVAARSAHRKIVPHCGDLGPRGQGQVAGIDLRLIITVNVTHMPS